MARFEAFWEVACDFMHLIWLGVMIVVFLFVLSIIGLVAATPGSAAVAISLFNIALLVPMGVVSLWMFRVCAARQNKRY